MKKKVRTLIVDDSAVVRQTLESILSSDPKIEVVGTASDPFVAAKRMKEIAPDVITLDVEMPRMDGITFLKKIMSQHPIPVVMCSSLTEEGCETTFKALEYGAVEVITKPKMGTQKFLEESKMIICDAVKSAAEANVKKLTGVRKKPVKLEVTRKLSADAVLAAPIGRAMARTTERLAIVGASTGGTEALKHFLLSMPKDGPGTVIVQHMPENFTKSFANRLNGICDMEIKEAVDGDSVLRGLALIAPGNKHTLLKRSGARYYVEIKDGPLVSRHRPSVDVLFRSAAHNAGPNAVGVIMTGMGDDGAKGMKEMKDAGSYNIAQDEASCIVFGMPNEAIKAGGVDKILSLDAIAGAVLRGTADV